MNHSRSIYVGLLVALWLVPAIGCAGSRPTADEGADEDEKVEAERSSGGIAAAAGEQSGWDSTVDAEESKRQPFSLTEGLLRGQVAGVEVFQRRDGTLSVRIRGATSILGGNEPLYVIDGMPILHMGEGVALNPHDIRKIEVLKDADSKALYGARGANGVVLITTKIGPDDQEK